MADFRKRLQRAVRAGQTADRQRTDEERQNREKNRALRALHERYEAGIRDRIGDCLRDLIEEFPGFDLQDVYHDKGRGYAILRDDSLKRGGASDRYYSRLEIYVHHFKEHGFLEVTAKGSIRNREKFHRTEDDRLEDLDAELFSKFIERLVLQYARDYADDDKSR